MRSDFRVEDKKSILGFLETLIKKVKETPGEEIVFESYTESAPPIDVTCYSDFGRVFLPSFGSRVTLTLHFSEKTKAKAYAEKQRIAQQEEFTRGNWRKKQIKVTEKVTDTTIMWFGEHKGKAMANVPDSYLWYLYNTGRAFGTLRDYIVDNLDTIKKFNK